MSSFHKTLGSLFQSRASGERPELMTLSMQLLRSSQEHPVVRTRVLVLKEERAQRKQHALTWFFEEQDEDVLFSVDIPPLHNVEVGELLSILNKGGGQRAEVSALGSWSLHARVNYDVFIPTEDSLRSISEDVHKRAMQLIKAEDISDDTKRRIYLAASFCSERGLECYKRDGI